MKTKISIHIIWDDLLNSLTIDLCIGNFFFSSFISHSFRLFFLNWKRCMHYHAYGYVQAQMTIDKNQSWTGLNFQRLLLLCMSSCAKGSSVIIDSMTAQINWNSDICIDIIMKVHETNVCQLTIEIAWKLLMDARELRIRIRIRFQRMKICSALSDCHTNNASASTCATGTHWTHEMKEGKPNTKNAQRNSTCSELRCWAERAQLMRLLWME